MFSFRRYFKLGSMSYRELSERVFKEMMADNVTAYAAAMAYYLLFALFPFFLFLVTIVGYLPLTGLLDSILLYLKKLLPHEAFTLVEGNLRHMFSARRGGLLSLGVLLALWSSASTMTSLMDVMNRLYGVNEGRRFYKVWFTAVLLVTGLSILFILSLILLMFGPRIGEYVMHFTHAGNAFMIAWDVLLAPVILFMLILSIAVIYYFSPDVKQEWKWITPGSVFAIPIWIAASLGFSYYVNNFGSYNKTYGSIGAVIVLLLWLYISGFVILAGAEINAVIEHASKEGKEPGEKEEDEHEKKPEAVDEQESPAERKKAPAKER